MIAFLAFIRLFMLAALLAALIIPAALLRCTAAQSVTAGMIDDNLVHLPANYTTFTPPAVGVTFNDSAYNTLITRLSNGVTQFPGGDGVHHEYAVMSPFNANNTRILVAAHFQGFYVIDRSGAIIVPPAQVNIGHLAEPCWSTTDPNIFYFRETNQLRKYDISTQTKTTIRTFNGMNCPPMTNCPNFTEVKFGKGEADISEDGDHLVIMGNTGGGHDAIVGLYTISTNTLGPTRDLSENTPPGNPGVDHCDVTPNNNVICRYNFNGVCTPATTDCYRGYALWNGQTMAFIRQVMPWGAHADRSRDANGDEVLLIAAYNDNDSVCPGFNGVEKIKLSDGTKTCLVSLAFASEIHISTNSNRVNGVNTNPWMLVSYTDTGNGTANPNATLPGNWQTIWGVRYNELLLIKIDGTENRRLLHHRTRKVANDDYWFTPRAAISRDGRYAVFDSNPQALTTPDDYTDVYLADLVVPNNGPLQLASAASYKNTEVAVESVVRASASKMATTMLSATTTSLPTTLAGTTVSVRDSVNVTRAAGLYFITPNQLNFQVPTGTAAGAAQITLNNAQGYATGTIQIAAVCPALFSADSSGAGLMKGHAVRTVGATQIIEQVARFDPITRQWVAVPLAQPTTQVKLLLLGTGFRNRSSLGAVTATVGGTPVTVVSANASSTTIGFDELCLQLPALTSGLKDIAVTVDGKAANIVKVQIQP